jgi:hypothetical protein
MDKGTPGEHVFADSLKAWKQAGRCGLPSTTDTSVTVGAAAKCTQAEVALYYSITTSARSNSEVGT